MAYRGLGVEYGNVNQYETGLPYIKKAFELKDRASEREKLAITSDYYQWTGQTDKAIETYDKAFEAGWVGASYHRITYLTSEVAFCYTVIDAFERFARHAVVPSSSGPDSSPHFLPAVA